MSLRLKRLKALYRGLLTWLNVTLGPLPVTLAPVKVVGQPSRMLSDFSKTTEATAAEKRMAELEPLAGKL